MKLKLLLACAVVLITRTLLAQITGDVIGMHDLSPGSSSPITGARPGSCTYCHAPHSGLASGKALWNQTLSKQVYSLYTSPTYHQTGPQPVLGADSSLCLSCHDGTVAVGQTIVGGKVSTIGSMYATDVFGTNLQSSHPFSVVLPIKDAPDLVESLASKGQTADPTGAIKLINGNIECTSCHNAHVQAKDLVAQYFLAKDSSQGAMCMACHDPNRRCAMRSIRWRDGRTSAQSGDHQSGGRQTCQATGPVATNACFSCHTAHNALGPARWLLVRMNRTARLPRRRTNLTPAMPPTSRSNTPRSGIPFPLGTLRSMRPKMCCSTTIRTPPAPIATTARVVAGGDLTVAPAMRVSQSGVGE